jgi:GTP-binding protein HflX
MFEVWNKIDLLDSDSKEVFYARSVTSRDAQKPLPVSAVTGEGIEALLARVAILVDAEGEEIDLVLEPHQGDALAFLYQHGRVIARHEDEDGKVHVKVKLSDMALPEPHSELPGYLCCCFMARP